MLKSQGLGVLLVAADLQRPAAVEQLRVLGRQLDLPVWSAPDDGPKDPVEVARTSLDEAARLGKNLVIVDTAGRLQVDTELMDELRHVRDAVHPTDTLLVVDAMTGQEAVNVATAFDEAVGLDGVVLTKIDGDARGGAALSVKDVVGKPILFVGTGEKLEDFEAFHPDRMASRILGMGDVLTLIEKAEAAFDQGEAAVAEEKLRKGQFTLEDFLDQMRQVQQDGPDRQPDEDDAGDAEGAAQGGDRRGRAGPGRGDHLLDDPGRAPRPVADQRLPAGADRQGQRHDHRRRSTPCSSSSSRSSR